MTRAILRLAVLAVTALVAVVGAVVGLQAPASASNENLGWMRLTPDSGRIDVPVDALTQGTCPGGEAVVMSLTGPGVPRTGDIGYIVGNTALSALAPSDGHLSVPLRVTFVDWFAENAPGVKPKGTYTLRLVCRDRLRASKTYGEYVAQVAIAGGRFRALGSAAQPATTTPAPTPVASAPVAQPGTTSSPAPAGSAAPSASGSGAGPGVSPGSTAPAASQSATPVAAPAATDAGDGSATRLLLLGLAAAAVLGVGVMVLRTRGGSTGEHAAPARPRDQP